MHGGLTLAAKLRGRSREISTQRDQRPCTRRESAVATRRAVSASAAELDGRLQKPMSPSAASIFWRNSDSKDVPRGMARGICGIRESPKEMSQQSSSTVGGSTSND